MLPLFRFTGITTDGNGSCRRIGPIYPLKERTPTGMVMAAHGVFMLSVVFCKQLVFTYANTTNAPLRSVMLYVATLLDDERLLARLIRYGGRLVGWYTRVPVYK